MIIWIAWVTPIGDKEGRMMFFPRADWMDLSIKHLDIIFNISIVLTCLCVLFSPGRFVWRRIHKKRNVDNHAVSEGGS